MAMDLDYTIEERAFRDDVNAWLRDNLPEDLRDKVVHYRHLSRDDLQHWHAILARQGWVAPSWPREWGGRGLTPAHNAAWIEECARVGVPPFINMVGIVLAGGAILRFGSPDGTANR